MCGKGLQVVVATLYERGREVSFHVLVGKSHMVMQVRADSGTWYCSVFALDPGRLGFRRHLGGVGKQLHLCASLRVPYAVSDFAGTGG